MNAGGPRSWPALRLALATAPNGPSLDQSSYSPEVRFRSAVDLLATYARRAQDLAPLLASAQLNGDLNRRLQYMDGVGLNSVIDRVVYRALLSYRKFPEDLVAGSGDGVNLHELIGHRAF
jgi:hypothetical protein